MLSSPFRSSKPFYMHPVFFYNCIIITPASATKFCYIKKLSHFDMRQQVFFA